MASKADMTPEEREAKEQEEFSTGPLRSTNLTPSNFTPTNSFNVAEIKQGWIYWTTSACLIFLWLQGPDWLCEEQHPGAHQLQVCVCWIQKQGLLNTKSSIGTTRSCWGEWRHLTGTATWCWRESRRCGLNSLRLEKVGIQWYDILWIINMTTSQGRRRPSLWTRTGSSPRCSWGATLSFLSSRTPWPLLGPLRPILMSPPVCRMIVIMILWW